MASNILDLMKRLNEAESRAKRAEARCADLEAENLRLRQETTSKVLVSDLQRRLADEIERNTLLEADMHRRLSAQRLQLEQIAAQAPSARRHLL